MGRASALAASRSLGRACCSHSQVLVRSSSSGGLLLEREHGMSLGCRRVSVAGYFRLVQQNCFVWREKSRLRKPCFFDFSLGSLIPHQLFICSRDWSHSPLLKAKAVNSFEQRTRLDATCVYVDEALEAVEQQGMVVSAHMLYQLLEACMAKRDVAAGRRVHDVIVRMGLGSNVFLGHHLIRMYSSCGNLIEANRVFGNLSWPDNHVWAAIISAHVKHGQPRQAIQLYHTIHELGIEPDDYVCVAVLRACASAVALEDGKLIQNQMMERGHVMNVAIGHNLIDLYVKCGSLWDASIVFDGLWERDVVTWTMMIAGYGQQGDGEEALNLFHRMQRDGIQPDKVAFVNTLKACSAASALEQVRLIHAQVVALGFDVDVVVGSRLMDAYNKCWSLEEARDAFERVQMKDVMTWTAMMAYHTQRGDCEQALQLFYQMLNQRVQPDKVTLVTILKACSSIAASDWGKLVHAYITAGGLELDSFAGNILIDMYAKCGNIAYARQVFDGLPTKDLIAWTTMVAAYVDHGDGHDAFQIYHRMQQERITPDHVFLVTILRACSTVGALDQGKLVHAHVVERSLESVCAVGNSVMDMYVKCGSVQDAQTVFQRLPSKDVVSWNIMVAGYCQEGMGQVALQLYQKMHEEGLQPSKVTLMGMLRACTSVATLDQGNLIERHILESGLQLDVSIANTLISMYSNCGSLGDARRVFDRMANKDLVSWNVMTAGYAQHGDAWEALELFVQMQQRGMCPNHVTFVSLLSACSHAGLCEEGIRLFQTMSEGFGITPEANVYACMVDLLSRCGRLREAKEFIRKMPVEPDVHVWRAFLCGCRTHGNLELGRWSFEAILKLDPLHAAAYVVMADMYGTASRFSDKEEIISKMKLAGAKKEPGLSWIEFDNQVHTFAANDWKHPEREQIHSKLEALLEGIT